jgi:hypothetical protein
MNAESVSARSLLWSSSRWWNGSGPLALATTLGVAACLAAAWMWQASQRARATQATLTAQLTDTQHAQRAAPPAAAASAADFTTDLPLAASPAQALAVVQSAAASASVTVDAVQVQGFAASTERLGRAELSLTARGSYANLKRWIGEVTERIPASTLSRLQLQRAEGAADVEARLTVMVWSRPAVPGAERR